MIYNKYKSIDSIAYKSRNLIYQLSFKFCIKNYISKTSNSLKTRMTDHRFDVVHKIYTKSFSVHAIKNSQICKVVLISKVSIKSINLLTYNLRNVVELAHQLILKLR